MKIKKSLSVILSIIIILGTISLAYANEETHSDCCITVPNNVNLFVGEKTDAHFVNFTEIQPSETILGENTKYCFSLEDDKTYNYRITSDDYITYAGTFVKTPDFNLEITNDMLITDGKDKKTTDRDVFSNNGFNVADIYLNINPEGYLKLSENETFQIVNLRNWEAVNNVSSNYFIEPDYNYTVINENGEPSEDVVSISENGLITAKSPGTAIVLVTYDALNLNFDGEKEFYGAIWPENTGVFVVSVGSKESSISTNMTLNKNSDTSKLAGDFIDSELDIIYYTGENGTYTFSPEPDTCSVFVANPIIDEGLSYNGFNEISKSEDNSFTIPLTEGKNIVKIVADDEFEYRIISAKKINITVNEGNPVKPGDKISIVFDKLYHPVNKLAGVYNMNAVAVYTKVLAYEDKTIGALTTQYDFASNSDSQTVCNILKEKDVWGSITYEKDSDLIVPEDYTKDTFTLSEGSIYVSGFGDAYGNHRGISYETGKAPNLNADARLAWLGKLPDIEIPITQQTDVPENSGSEDNSDDPESSDGEDGSDNSGSSGSSSNSIKVYLTLLGDEKHGEPESKSETHTMKKDNLETWISKKLITLDKESFVIDAVKKAFDAEDIAYTYDNYLKSVNGLKEFDNGKSSGWMYLLNGEYAPLGMSDQKLENGDKIIIHYTDDYMAEFSDETEDDENSGSSSSSSSNSKKSKKTSKTNTVVTEVINEKQKNFIDVLKSEWYYDAINYVYEKNLMSGVSETEFAPDDNMTRAMLVTVLYRMEDAKITDNGNLFKDVRSGMWYTDAVIWAYNNGIVKGVSETEFAPDENITREQLAAIIYRYAEFKKVNTKTDYELIEFSDSDSVSSWAKNAVKWSIGNKLMNGTSDTLLSPHDTATRSQVAAILMRFTENVLQPK